MWGGDSGGQGAGYVAQRTRVLECHPARRRVCLMPGIIRGKKLLEEGDITPRTGDITSALLYRLATRSSK